MSSPDEMVSSSATFVMDNPAPFTTIVSEAETGGTLVASAVAVFAYVPALALVVALTAWTEADSPGAMSPKEQLRVCVGGAPETAHVPGPA
jgi:hypothetical protein